jgi:glycosyltransferase involved in cell wall biosynthesis
MLVELGNSITPSRILRKMQMERLMRVAIVAPWYTANGGAEKVDGVLGEIYPDADFFALFYRETGIPAKLKGRAIQGSFLQRIPGIDRVYRPLLSLFPYAVESFDMSGYDLVITSDWACIKGVVTDPNTVNVCYCHTPMRHIWDLYRTYLTGAAAWQRPAYAWSAKGLREWDYQAAQRVTHFAANSIYIQHRIERYYGRSSAVIYPPVDTSKGYISSSTGNYYLSLSRLNRTKRIDLLIHACNRLGRKLIVSGWGPEEKELKKIAGSTIEFVGRVPDSEVGGLFANCRALLFAADEDFGIVPVEAQSYGRPVVAYGRGGSLETVRVGDPSRGSDTGVFFSEQTPESVIDGIQRFEKTEDEFCPKAIQKHARTFAPEQFVDRFRDFIEIAMSQEKVMAWK